MTVPRLFLIAPESLNAKMITDCATAACAAGDVASIVVPAAALKDATKALQNLGLAVLSSGVASAGCDGVHISHKGDLSAARQVVGKNGIVGVYCAASRHAAMEAADAGADYIALSQNSYAPKEPIIGWWADLFEVPCVAFDPVGPTDLDILLPQNPDFIRPGDAMWESSEAATRLIDELMRQIKHG
jgi:thiamine-phosphate pyrophosphorylase